MPPAVSLQNVNKHYEDVHALKDLSLDIQEGEFFGYLGPNGAGKTTTIEILTGLADLDTGTATVLGHDVTDDYQQARRALGLSPQEYNFDPYFSIKTLLIYQAGYYGVPRAEARQRSEHLLDQFGILDKQDATFRELSGGMKRRLALARALMHDPPILILDEPTAGLDVELRRELWQYMREINEQGKTILLTTHYIEEAEKLCDRIGVLKAGELIQVDDKENMVTTLGRKHLTVETPAQEIPEAIKDLDQASTLENGTLRIELPPDADTDAIIKIVQENVEIEDILVERDDLEEIFVRLVSDE